MFPKILDYLIILVESLSYDFRETFPGKAVAQKCTLSSLFAKACSALMKPAE